MSHSRQARCDSQDAEGLQHMKKLPAATAVALVATFRKELEEITDRYESSLRAVAGGPIEKMHRIDELTREFFESARAVRDRAHAALEAASIDTSDDFV